MSALTRWQVQYYSVSTVAASCKGTPQARANIMRHSCVTHASLKRANLNLKRLLNALNLLYILHPMVP
jgi:hypothetical protein